MLLEAIVSPGLSVLLVCWVSAGARAEPGLANLQQLQQSEQPQGQDPRLRTILESASSMEPSGVAALRSAVGQRSANGGTAAKSFEGAAKLLPGMADWANLLAAESAARTGDTASVRRFLSATEPGLALTRGWRALSDARRNAGDAAGAQSALEAALPSLGAVARADALLRIGKVRASRGNTAGAREAYRQSIETAPMTPAGLEAGRQLADMPGGQSEDALIVGRLFFRHSNGARGIAGFDAYLSSAQLSTAQRYAIRLEAAKGLFDSQRYTAAEVKLRALASETAAGPAAGDALVLLGRLQIRKGQIEAARITLRRAIDHEPAPVTLPEALFALADLDHDRGAMEAASAGYRRLIAEHPGSEQAAEAAVRLGSLEYAAGRYASAAKVFDAFRAAHSVGARALQAGFWSGQALLLSGDTAAAVSRLESVAAQDPASYYGLRASETLGQTLRTTLTVSPAVGTADVAAARGGVARIALLEQLGLRDEAAFETDRLKRYFGSQPAGLYTLAEGMHAGGRLLDAVRLGREIQRSGGGWNERLLRIVYPLPFEKEILAAAGKRGIDPYIVAGLIRQESLFDATARSGAGAIGLMQIMPPTGRELARKDGLSGFATNMLRDPAVNIRLGTLFFADLLQRNGGSLTYALAAYNAGPSRVARWRKNPEAADPDLFAERIPFAETRDYVRVVQQNARIYAALYGSEDAARR
jgi:peptidoglycan lytic transglycosylase